MKNRTYRLSPAALLVAAALLLVPTAAQAHCDGLDGPVVKAARQALEAKNANLVLPWVRPGDGAEIRKAFAETLAVRALNPAARDLADRYFFETLVRVHRTGEGAPYTGLKPAGRDLGPAIPAADQAVESGSPDAVRALLTRAVQSGLEQRFKSLAEQKAHAAHSVEAGRAWVAAYVDYLHFVERVHQATAAAAPEHAAAHHEHD